MAYIGTDEKFFETLTSKYAEIFPDEEIELQMESKKDDDQFYYKVFKSIVNSDHKIIYIDLTIPSRELSSIAKYIRREERTTTTTIVIFVANEKQIWSLRGLNPHFFIIKSVDVFQSVYGPWNLTFPENEIPNPFVYSKNDEKFTLHDPLRIGFITPAGIHGEGDIFLKPEEDIALNLSHPPEGVELPSDTLKVSKVDNTDMYYHNDFCYELEFKFGKEPDYKAKEKKRREKFEKLKRGFGPLGPEDVIKKVREFNEIFPPKSILEAQFELKMDELRKVHKNWIVEYKGMAKPKKIKVLLIDNELKFLSNLNIALGDLPYTVRILTGISGQGLYIEKLQPNVIALIYDKAKKNERGELVDVFTQLKDVIKIVKTKPNFTPIIILFNCKKFSSMELKSLLEYDNIICYEEDIELKTVLNMCKILEEKERRKFLDSVKKKMAQMEKKNPEGMENLTTSSFQEDRYYVDSHDVLSHGHIIRDIEVIEINELELLFFSEFHFKLNGIYQLHGPISLYITLVPPDEDSKITVKKGQNLYRGVINGLDEGDVLDLRDIINKVVK